MGRVDGPGRAHRLNKAVELIDKWGDARAVRMLAKRFDLSTRQAYRYICEAKGLKQPVAVPEYTTVFAVKIPRGLAERFREFARLRGETISGLAVQALESFLRTKQRRPRKAK